MNVKDAGLKKDYEDKVGEIRKKKVNKSNFKTGKRVDSCSQERSNFYNRATSNDRSGDKKADFVIETSARRIDSKEKVHTKEQLSKNDDSRPR